MKINGWHRLWAAVSAFVLSSCVVFVYVTWPEEQSITHSKALYDALDPNALAQIAEHESTEESRVQMPNGHVILLKPEVVVSKKTEALLQYQDAVAKELSSKKRRLLINAFKIWVALCAALLIVGHLIAWVVRGFQGSKSAANSP